MNRIRIASCAIAVVALATAVAALSCSPNDKPTAEAQPAAVDPAAQVERGKYLAVVAGCHDCHTPGYLYGAPDFSRALSGSELGWQGPWGTSYPRNLTPDEETGLGRYSADEIVAAIKGGKRLDGSPMLPPMPWQNYATMTDEDLHALAAYLKSLAPVKHAAPAVVPPGQKPGAALTFPPPPAWDAPRTP
jgi:mono/diheme cytochrome c family protein